MAASIDMKKFAAWVESTGKTPRDLSLDLGRGRGYIGSILAGTSKPSAAAITGICRIYGLPESYFDPDPTPVTTVEACVAELITADTSGYSLSLKIYPNRVRLGLCRDGAELSFATSRIKPGREEELNLYQAISYAAHMLYKLKEQEVLENG